MFTAMAQTYRGAKCNNFFTATFPCPGKFKTEPPAGTNTENNRISWCVYGALMCCKKDTPVDKEEAIVWHVTDGEKGFKLRPQSKNK